MSVFVRGIATLGLVVCSSLIIANGIQLGVAFLSIKAAEAKTAVLGRLPAREILIERQELSAEEAAEEAARRHKVDPLILKVILQKESANGSIRALYRFEPDLFARLRRDPEFKKLSDSEVRMLSSSHGAFHILGLTGEKSCGIHFSQLYSNNVAADCAARIIKSIEGTVQTKDSTARLREIFKRYNGAGKAADAYASDAIMRLAGILYSRPSRF